MTTATLAPTVPAADRFLAAIERGRPAPDVLAPAVTLDAVVPEWRFALVGDEAVAAQLATWYPVPMRLEEVRRLRLPGGELIEMTAVWEERGVPFAARQVYVLDVDPSSDRITAIHTWCGGRWSAARLAEMEAAGAR